MILSTLLILLVTLSVSWRVWHRLRFFLHMSQLHGYKAGEFSEWLFSRGRKHLLRPAHVVALLAIMVGYQFGSSSTLTFVGYSLCLAWLIIFASATGYLNPAAKKPIKFTGRVKRLTTASALILIALGLVVAFPLDLQSDTGVFRILAGLSVIDFAVPLVTLLAGLVALPIEKVIQNGYKKQARQKLASMPQLKIIAITGSYGKTSVKFAVSEILKQRYNVLATPGSFNTPMGICLVINRDLKPEHQILILEMGARYAGDIQELCDIAKPDVGIVTNVGVAHLETFGSVENIAKEKGVLVENVGQNGLVILNGDDLNVRAMQSRTKAKIIFAGMDSDDSVVQISDLSYNTKGASFTLASSSEETVNAETRLVGKHNIHNIVTAAAVGLQFGLRMRQIAHAANRLEPVQHRLEVKNFGDLTVIDDAFNSNPVGANNAVEILGQFPANRRIIVTPGMIELGDLQYEENRKLGVTIAGNVDLAILIGHKQTEPIQDGLRESNFPEDQLQIFSSLSEAQDFLKSFTEKGDVVLYENDLPDQFDEDE